MTIADDLKKWRQDGPFRQLRKDLGLSIRDMATAFGITEAALRNWEEGRAAPSKTNLARLQEIAENEEYCRVAADYKSKPMAVRIEEWKKKTPSF